MSQVETNGLRLEVDISAPQQQSSPIPVLMIMGLGMQLTAWPAELVDGLLAQGRVAIVACGDRSAMLSRITAPTTIIHGRSDPLIPVAAAEDLGRKIPGSRVTIIEGMGHDLPPAVVPALLDAMRDTFTRGER
jgi:hypothetical protein